MRDMHKIQKNRDERRILLLYVVDYIFKRLLETIVAITIKVIYTS